MGHTIRTALRSRFGDQRQEGAALVEYGFLVLLIAVVCFGAVTLLGVSINTGIFQAAAGI